MRLLLTRPEPEGAALARNLEAAGHEVLVAPLLQIRPLDTTPDLTGVTDLIFTSINGVRSFAEREPRRDLQVHAVGDATAGAARDAGFASVSSAAGDARDLRALLCRNLQRDRVRLLHVRGRHQTGNLAEDLRAEGFQAASQALYEAVLIETFPAYARTALEKGLLDGILFFSPRTAQGFVCLAEREGVAEACRTVTAYCLSAAVAEAAAVLPWAAVRTARQPDSAALLALLTQD